MSHYSLPPRPEIYVPDAFVRVCEPEMAAIAAQSPKSTFTTLFARCTEKTARARAAMLMAQETDYGYKRIRKAIKRDARREKLKHMRNDLARVKLRVSLVVKMPDMRALHRSSAKEGVDGARQMHEIGGVWSSIYESERWMGNLVTLDHARVSDDIVRRPELFEMIERRI